MTFIIILASLPVLLALLYVTWQWRNLKNWRWAKTPYFSPPPVENPEVALLIPYRNEAANIPGLLLDLQAMEYPNLEVLFINDHSEDEGPVLVGAVAGAMVGMKKQGTVVRSLHLADHLKGQTVTAHKKAALAFAIAETTADIVVTTDADCRLPATLIQEIVASFNRGSDVVLGPVLIAPPHSTLLAGFQALDFASYQLYTAGCLAAASPTLANGACFAFRKSSFLAVDGYAGMNHLPSGDDVLLLHKFARQPGIRFGWHAGPPVLTRAISSWKGLWWQRIRWAGKAGEYVSSTLQYGQALAFLTALSIVVGLLLSPMSFLFLAGAVLAWLLKGTIDYCLLADITRHYGQNPLLRWYFPVMLIYPFYLVAVGSGALLGLKAEWKGR